MKKVIWVFGESATGKKTFIENIISNNENIRNTISFESNDIVALERTILSSEEEHKQTIQRHDAILEGIQNFIQSNHEILLIKGQTNDMNFEEGNANKQNTFKESIKRFPQVETSIILLYIPDNNLSYYRMTQKDWWQEHPEENAKWIPRDKWDAIVNNHNNQVLSFEQYGINIEIIDTTEGYKKVERNQIDKEKPLSN